jgi:hypothetical protein
MPCLSACPGAFSRNLRRRGAARSLARLQRPGQASSPRAGGPPCGRLGRQAKGLPAKQTGKRKNNGLPGGRKNSGLPGGREQWPAGRAEEQWPAGGHPAKAAPSGPGALQRRSVGAGQRAGAGVAEPVRHAGPFKQGQRAQGPPRPLGRALTAPHDSGTGAPSGRAGKQAPVPAFAPLPSLAGRLGNKGFPPGFGEALRPAFTGLTGLAGLHRPHRPRRLSPASSAITGLHRPSAGRDRKALREKFVDGKWYDRAKRTKTGRLTAATRC